LRTTPDPDNMDCVKEGGLGAVIDVHVVPNSKKEGLSYDEFTKRLKVKISAPAIDGKANKRLQECLSEIVGECQIISGQTSRKKGVLVPGKPRNEVLGLLSAKLAD
jgi:uncharacterized protein (TIGR00251 family)